MVPRPAGKSQRDRRASPSDGGRVPTSQRCGKEATFALGRFGPKRCMTPIVPDVHSSGGMMDIGKIIREVEIGRDVERDPFAPLEPRPEVPYG